MSARERAEAELAEAALAFTGLWCSLATDDFVRPAELVSILTRLAMLVPYAAITRQVSPSG